MIKLTGSEKQIKYGGINRQDEIDIIDRDIANCLKRTDKERLQRDAKTHGQNVADMRLQKYSNYMNALRAHKNKIEKIEDAGYFMNQAYADRPKFADMLPL